MAAQGRSQAELNAAFRAACGAYVAGSTKAGERAKHDLVAAAEARAAGANVDSVYGEGWTALHWAASEGRGSVVPYLVDQARCGVDVDVVDFEGCTPLWVTAYNGEYQAALLLLGAGADATVRGRPKGEPVMNASMAARSQGNLTIADVIDAETELRKQNPQRRPRLLDGSLSLDDFKATLRAVSKNPGTTKNNGRGLAAF